MDIECAVALLTPASNIALPYAICENGRLAVALSTGSETGFDNSYKVAHVMAKTFVTAVCESAQLPRQAIESTFITTQNELTQQFPDEDEIHSASATVIGVLICDRQAFIGWIGSEEAYHLSGGKLLTMTQPHIVGKLHPKLPAEFARMPSRLLLVDSLPPTPDIIEIQLSEGDQLVLVTQETLKYLNRDDIPHLIQSGTFLQAVQTSGWGAAAVIVKI